MREQQQTVHQFQPVIEYSSSPLLPRSMATSGDVLSGAATTTPTTTTKPLTMFYNGGVAVFHLPQDKAEEVMKTAATVPQDGGRKQQQQQQGAVDHGDALVAMLKQEMPIASKRSLHHFFQKRRERAHRP